MYLCLSMEAIVNIHTHTLREGELTPRCEGIHPWQAEQWSGEPPTLSAACEAVGEIGLDYACGVDRALQEALFVEQLKLAAAHNLPVVLHCVRAFEPMMRLLKGYPLRAVIFHGFIGSQEQARRAIERGYYLSFGERSLRSKRTVELMRRMPRERLFLESDESPTPIREIYRQASEIIEVDMAELERITMDNFKHIFR